MARCRGDDANDVNKNRDIVVASPDRFLVFCRLLPPLCSRRTGGWLSRRRRYASCCPARRLARRGFLTEFRLFRPTRLIKRSQIAQSTNEVYLRLPQPTKETLMKLKQTHGARRGLHGRALLTSL